MSVSRPTSTESGQSSAVVSALQGTRTFPWREVGGIVVCVLLYVWLRVGGLRDAVINDKLDEGIYLSLMQAVGSGKGALYRDYILCHPPGIVWVGAWLWPRVGGSLFALRLLYIVVTALGYAPLYLLTRRRYGVSAALITLALMTTSPGMANWLGRNIYLDPLLNVPLYIALWALLTSPRPRASVALGVGCLLGFSFIIKETALPIALCLCAALWLAARTRPAESADPAQEKPTGTEDPIGKWTWFWTFAGFAVTFGLLLASLLHLPNYGYYTFTLNARDVYQWALRPHELLNGFYALPLLLTFGMVGVTQMGLRGRSRTERALGLFALLLTLFMLLVPKRFYWRYLTAVAPLYCLGAAVWWARFRAVPHPRRTYWAVGVLASLLGLVHVLGLVAFRLYEEPNPPAYAEALTLLRNRPGPLFTLNPIWAAGSAHPLTPEVQQLIRATIFVPVTAADYAHALNQCPTILLDKETLRYLPNETLQDLRARCRSLFRYQSPSDRHYIEILSAP